MRKAWTKRIKQRVAEQGDKNESWKLLRFLYIRKSEMNGVQSTSKMKKRFLLKYVKEKRLESEGRSKIEVLQQLSRETIPERVTWKHLGNG